MCLHREITLVWDNDTSKDEALGTGFLLVYQELGAKRVTEGNEFGKIGGDQKVMDFECHP